MTKNHTSSLSFQAFIRSLESISEAGPHAPFQFFADVMSSKAIRDIFQKYCSKARERIFGPSTTVCAFILQALSPDKSLLSAVHLVNRLRLEQGQSPCSLNTGGYSQARTRCKLQLFQEIFLHVATATHQAARQIWQWRGRDIKVIDGTMLSCADTALNSLYFQRHGCAFGRSNYPMMKLVAIFSYYSGVVLDFVTSVSRGQGTGESSLALSILKKCAAGDVVLADSIYSNYYVMALCMKKNIDFVFHAFGARKVDFRKGKRLGPRDHILELQLPSQNSSGLDPDFIASLPSCIKVRETEVQLLRKGYRPLVFVLMTSFKDPQCVPAQELAWLYSNRWQVEVSFRDIKCTMGLEHLTGKSHEMVYKQLYAGLTGYNIVRKFLAASALHHCVLPLELSFKHAVRVVTDYRLIQSLFFLVKGVLDALVILKLMGAVRVNNRPGRLYPRRLKKVKNYRNYLRVKYKPKFKSKRAPLN